MTRIILSLIFLISATKPFAQLPKLTMPVGHTDRITSAIFTPDGKRVLTASDDGTAKLWNAESGHLLASFRDGKAALFSPGNKLIITIGETVIAWDAGSGRRLYTLEPDTANGAYEKVFFTPDGSRLFTTSFHYVRMWDAATGRLIADFGGTNRDVYPDGFLTPDGKKFVNIKDLELVQVWDTETGLLLNSFVEGGGIYDMILTPDGKHLLAQDLTLFDLETGEKAEAGTDDTDEEDEKKPGDEFSQDMLRHLRFNANGSLLAFERNDFKNRSVIVYDFKNKKILREFNMGDSYVDSIAFTADEKAIMVYDDGVKCWDITTGQLIYHIDVDYFGFVASNRDRSLHLTQHDDSDSVSVWNAASGKFLYRVKHPNVREVVISDDNTRLLTGDGIGFGVVWNTATLQPVSLLMEKITGIWDISFDPASNNFIPFTNSKTVSLRNLNTGRELNKLKLKGLPYDGEFSNNGRLVLIISTDSTATAWDTKTGKVLRTIKSAKSGIHSAVFSGDDKKILITEDRFLKLYNVADGKIIRQIPAPTGDFIRASMSQDGKFIAAYCYGNNSKGYKTLLAKRVKIFDAATGKLVRSVDGHKDLGVSSLTFSQSGRKIAMATYDSLLVFDLSVPSSKPVRKFNPDGALWKVVFSPDETKLLTTHNNTAPRLWNASDGKLIRQFDIPYEGELFSAIFTRDGTKFLTTASDNVIRVCDAETGSVICSMRDSVAALQTAQFNFDETRVITWSDNQSIKYWDYSRCSALFDMYATDENNLVYKLPNGYYMASPQASKLLHYVTEDLEVIGFDQLDLRFNRPDKVLQATSPGDTALIRAYYNAWQKRITRLGYDTSGFDSRLDLPGADFRERNTIAYDNRTGKLTLGISATDSLHPLERFNVWVNEVPVFGSRGVDISIKHTQVFDTTLSIGLSTGKNIIETAVSNATGLQSFKSPLQVHYTPPAKKDKMYFVGIGIDRFRDSTYNLRWSVKDIRDLAKALKKKHGEHIIIDTLYNEDVTVENVKRLRNTLTQAGADDKVIVAYSGHGLLSKGYDYYLSTYAVDFDNPQQHGLSYDVLEGLLDGLASRRKLMLIDACHSGEVDKEELAQYERIQATLDSTKKGVSLNLRKKRESMGTINSFELMQELFANVGRGTGATIISAAGGTQFALERGDLENGVFTYTILELMKKNKPTFLSQLKQHVNERVVELTRGAQVPTTRTENVVVDWEVW